MIVSTGLSWLHTNKRAFLAYSFLILPCQTVWISSCQELLPLNTPVPILCNKDTAGILLFLPISTSNCHHFSVMSASCCGGGGCSLCYFPTHLYLSLSCISLCPTLLSTLFPPCHHDLPPLTATIIFPIAPTPYHIICSLQLQLLLLVIIMVRDSSGIAKNDRNQDTLQF